MDNSMEEELPHPSLHLKYHRDGSQLPPHHNRHPYQTMSRLQATSEYVDPIPIGHMISHGGTLRSIAVSASTLSETVSGSDPGGSPSTSRRVVDPITQTEIKYTKNHSPCTASTCSYLFVALILIAVGATSGIYYSLANFDGRSLRERVFKVKFVITRGEPYDPRFEKPSSDLFKETSVKYEEKLNKLFNTSRVARSFKKSEVIALEKRKEGSDDVVIHTNLHFHPRSSPDISSADVYIILADEFLKSKNGLFSSVSIDQTGIDVTERRDDNSQGNRLSFPFYPSSFSSSLSLRDQERNSKASSDPSYFRSGYNYYRNPWEPRTRFPGVLEGLVTEPTPPVRRCQKIDLPFCSSILPYNETSYPNIMDHWNVSAVEKTLSAFRQVVDAECYPFAREFICRILQPECLPGDVLVYPCRPFCSEFKRSCGQWIDRMEDKSKNSFFEKMIKCSDFPRFDGDDGGDEISTKKPVSSTTPSTNRPFLTGSRVVYFDDDLDRSRNSQRLVLEKRRCRSKSEGFNELRAREQKACDQQVNNTRASLLESPASTTSPPYSYTFPTTDARHEIYQASQPIKVQVPLSTSTTEAESDRKHNNIDGREGIRKFSSSLPHDHDLNWSPDSL